MEFNSFYFLFFLIVVVTLNYFLAIRYRPSLLLLSSFVFIGYYSLLSLAAVLLFSVFNFYLAKNILQKRFLYFIALLVNVSAIVLFNYVNSSAQGIAFAFSAVNFNIGGFIVAVGLSFYSLQNIAYVTDIYYKRAEPQRSILQYILYTSFFPKVLSGPVMLPDEFIPQINNNRPNPEMLASGINRFLTGLLKKMVIADRLSPVVHGVFDGFDTYSGFTTVVGIYLFTIQLYFDFSGYADMAVGAGKMLGYELKENFNLPLRSTSITEFWRRWHISLISWFTNYIYYPVVYRLRTYRKSAVVIGIISTFLISAVWHGIGFTFLLWGACHIVYMSVEYFTKSARATVAEYFHPLFYKVFSVFVVFNAVCFSNIFFRSHSVAQAVQLIKNTCSNFIPANWLTDFISPLAHGGNQIEQFNFSVTVLLTLALLLFERSINKRANEEQIHASYVSLCVLLILVFGVISNGERFIYMQF